MNKRIERARADNGASRTSERNLTNEIFTIKPFTCYDKH